MDDPTKSQSSQEARREKKEFFAFFKWLIQEVVRGVRGRELFYFSVRKDGTALKTYFVNLRIVQLSLKTTWIVMSFTL